VVQFLLVIVLFERFKTAPTKKAGFRASYDSFVVNQTLVFQMKFCVKSPALRVAAKR
jgi:hypothetical protein